MERKFYPENFERFLRGHADQFKMSPSKKVWHGIYNDLHPGRRWPSIAMSMLFIFTLVIVGHLNTNNGRTTSLHDLPSLQASHEIKTGSSSRTVKQTKLNLKDKEVNNPGGIIADDNNFTGTAQQSIVRNIQPPGITADVVNSNGTKLIVVSEIKNETSSLNKIEIPETNINAPITNDGIDKPKVDMATSNEQETINNTPNLTKEVNSFTNEPVPGETLLNTPNTPSEANAISSLKLKKISNVSWSYYIAPTVSHRVISDDKINNAVIHKPMLGYEAGTAMSFNIFKRLQFTSGLQLNYTGYNIRANNTHPTFALLVLNSEVPGQFTSYSSISHYGNRTGAEFTQLKNYSLQASVPIGLQYLLAEKDNVSFGAAASFQPSVTIASQAYLLSTDRRNYLQSPDLFRQWNMNTNFTLYTSFKSNTFNWQIGPQVRYQLLSSYTKKYPVKENLVNYGIRIGISKISK